MTSILNDAKFITPQLGELPCALAGRMSDSNTNLVQAALTIGQTLATSMGPSCKQHVRTLLPGFLQALSVNKPTVRATAVACLNAWVDQCNGMKDFFEGEVIAEALNKGNPFVKSDLLTWLADKLPNSEFPTSQVLIETADIIAGICVVARTVSPKTLNKDDMSACLPHLFAALEDRNAEVRKGAQDATLGFMIHLGYECLARNAAKLKPVSKPVVMAHLDKVRPNLPAKPAPAPAPAAAAAPSTAVRGRGAATPSASAAAAKESPKEDEDSNKAAVGKGLRAPAKSKVSCFLLPNRFYV